MPAVITTSSEEDEEFDLLLDYEKSSSRTRVVLTLGSTNPPDFSLFFFKAGSSLLSSI